MTSDSAPKQYDAMHSLHEQPAKKSRKEDESLIVDLTLCSSPLSAPPAIKPIGQRRNPNAAHPFFSKPKKSNPKSYVDVERKSSIEKSCDLSSITKQDMNSPPPVILRVSSIIPEKRLSTTHTIIHDLDAVESLPNNFELKSTSQQIFASSSFFIPLSKRRQAEKNAKKCQDVPVVLDPMFQAVNEHDDVILIESSAPTRTVSAFESESVAANFDADHVLALRLQKEESQNVSCSSWMSSLNKVAARKGNNTSISNADKSLKNINLRLAAAPFPSLANVHVNWSSSRRLQQNNAAFPRRRLPAFTHTRGNQNFILKSPTTLLKTVNTPPRNLTLSFDVLHSRLASSYASEIFNTPLCATLLQDIRLKQKTCLVTPDHIPDCADMLLSTSARSIAAELSDWLSRWNHHPRILDIPRGRRSHFSRALSGEDDLDDFIDDFEEDDDGSYFPDETSPKPGLLISGPTSSFKTVTIHSVAKQNGYSILELNSSQRRGTKEVLALLEATLSHSLIGNGSQKASIFDKGKKSTAINATSSVFQKCIILLEDVDILGGADKGFWGAVWQILKSSKRPIILTCTEYPFVLSNISVPSTLLYPLESCVRVIEANAPMTQEKMCIFHLLLIREGMWINQLDELARLCESMSLKSLLHLATLYKEDRKMSNSIDESLYSLEYVNLAHLIYHLPAKIKSQSASSSLHDGAGHQTFQTMEQMSDFLDIQCHWDLMLHPVMHEPLLDDLAIVDTLDDDENQEWIPLQPWLSSLTMHSYGLDRYSNPEGPSQTAPFYYGHDQAIMESARLLSFVKQLHPSLSTMLLTNRNIADPACDGFRGLFETYYCPSSETFLRPRMQLALDVFPYLSIMCFLSMLSSSDGGKAEMSSRPRRLCADPHRNRSHIERKFTGEAVHLFASFRLS